MATEDDARFEFPVIFETTEVRNKEEKETIKRGSFTQLPLSIFTLCMASSGVFYGVKRNINSYYYKLVGLDWIIALFREVFSES